MKLRIKSPIFSVYIISFHHYNPVCKWVKYWWMRKNEHNFFFCSNAFQPARWDRCTEESGVSVTKLVKTLRYSLISTNECSCVFLVFPFRSRNPGKKHRTTGFDPEWPKEHPWLLNTPDGMLCRLCKKHCPLHHSNFIKQPSTNYRLDAVVAHERSETHRDAARKESNLIGGNMTQLWGILCSEDKVYVHNFKLMYSSLYSGGTVTDAFAVSASIEHQALEGCFQLIHECAKQKWPHHTSYVPLMDMCKRMGCSFFESLKVSFIW